jgi:high-affinity Fe2+/Pb2+ permease
MRFVHSEMSDEVKINNEYDKSSKFIDVTFLNYYWLGSSVIVFFYKIITKDRRRDVLTSILAYDILIFSNYFFFIKIVTVGLPSIMIFMKKLLLKVSDN